MKRIIYLFLVFALPAGAQTFFPMKKGAVLEYKYVNTKGKQLRNAWNA